VEPTDALVEVDLGGHTIASTRRSLRVLETSHPPTYYIPSEDVVAGALTASPKRTFCEFKGTAHYYDVVGNETRAGAAAWGYADPSPGYEVLRNHVAFYPSRMGECRVGGEVVTSQEGDFYGGWITSAIAGPFKGAPGTSGW
jgi:uncharacterized protein (DUF427 family)